MSRTIHISEEAYQRISVIAQRHGCSVDEWVDREVLGGQAESAAKDQGVGSLGARLRGVIRPVEGWAGTERLSEESFHLSDNDVARMMGESINDPL